MKFDKENNTLEIKDNLKMHFMLLRFIFIINVANAVLRIYNNYLAGVQDQPILIILGVISALALLYMRSRSTQEIIPIDEIEYLKEKKMLGNRRFFLKLKNGKTRNLPFKNTDIEEFERIIKGSGIRTLNIKD